MTLLRILRMKERILLLKEIAKRQSRTTCETQTKQSMAKPRKPQEMHGFGEQVFDAIKQSEHLQLIASVANANLFNLRNRCTVYHCKDTELDF